MKVITVKFQRLQIPSIISFFVGLILSGIGAWLNSNYLFDIFHGYITIAHSGFFILFGSYFAFLLSFIPEIIVDLSNDSSNDFS